MTTSARTFAVVLPTLLVAHSLGDHVTGQTDHQAAHKATSWRAMAGHLAGYHATLALALAGVCAATDVRPRRRSIVAGLGFSAATHAFLDRRWPVRRALELTRSPGFARSAVVRVHHSVDGYGRVHTPGGVPHDVEAAGVLPLHGPYLADQALHHGCLLVAALIMAGGAR